MSESPASSSIAEAFSTRSAPWSNDAEQAVLGAMLLDQDAALSAAQLLADDMFYREGHRRLFRAMVSLTVITAARGIGWVSRFDAASRRNL